jgi:hypothetical protein
MIFNFSFSVFSSFRSAASHVYSAHDSMPTYTEHSIGNGGLEKTGSMLGYQKRSFLVYIETDKDRVFSCVAGSVGIFSFSVLSFLGVPVS